MPQLSTEAQIKITTKADTGGIKEAKEGVDQFGGSLDRIKEIALGVGLERLTEKFIELGRNASEFAIKTAADFEQWKISFDVMLGSGEKASKLMNELSNFAIKTPFELPQLVESSKQLLAFGIGANDIIPTLKTLGDISAGVGTDKLPQLTHALGQVSAGEKLTGLELKEFVMAGVPLLDALSDHFSKLGQAVTEGGGKVSKHKVDMVHLNSEISIQNHVLKDLHDKHKEGTVQYERATEHLRQLTTQTNTASTATKTYTTHTKLSGEAIRGMISNGKVSFKDVQESLDLMTSKGGRFFDLMNKQSRTFNGIVSNIRDNFTRMALDFMGFDMTDWSKTFGEVKSGSIFDQLRHSAQAFMDWINTHREQITAFFQAIVIAIQLVVVVIGKLIEIFGWLKQHTDVAISILSGLAVLVFPLVVAAVTVLITALSTLIFTTIPALIVAFGPIIAVAAVVALAVYALQDAWKSNFMGIRNITETVINGVINLLNFAIKAINAVNGGFNSLAGKITGVKGQIGSLSEIGQISIDKNVNTGVTYGPPVPAALGGNGFSTPAKGVNIYQTNNNYSQMDMDAALKQLNWQYRNQ